mgnify:CR=1 FL=1
MNKQSQVSMGNTDEVAYGRIGPCVVDAYLQAKSEDGRTYEKERTELTCGSVVVVYHNLLVSEMGSRRTVRMT